MLMVMRPFRGMLLNLVCWLANRLISRSKLNRLTIELMFLESDTMVDLVPDKWLVGSDLTLICRRISLNAKLNMKRCCMIAQTGLFLLAGRFLRMPFLGFILPDWSAMMVRRTGEQITAKERQISDLDSRRTSARSRQNQSQDLTLMEQMVTEN